MWEQLEVELAEEFGDIQFEKIKGGFHTIKLYEPREALPRQPKYNLTFSQRVFELYSSGMSERATAEACGIGRQVVATILKKLGADKRAPVVVGTTAKRVADQFGARYSSIEEAGRKLNLSPSRIRRGIAKGIGVDGHTFRYL